MAGHRRPHRRRAASRRGALDMGIGRLFRYAAALPPRVALAKGWQWGWRMIGAHVADLVLAGRETHAPCPFTSALARLVPTVDPALLGPHAPALAWLCRRYREHRFDLLGSGWTVVERSRPLRLSPGNRARARKIQGLLSPDYRPIDWQLDFRSGYRWSERRRAGTVSYGHEPGVDIKVPWELARLQHLPHLAWGFVLATAGHDGFEPPVAYRTEIRDQILDLLASNPPGHGVNWACPMDVAIRAVNMLVAVDLARAHGAEFDAEFLAELEAGVLAHARHVAANLEWHPLHRGNHYLADIAGLLVMAAYLPPTPESDRWLAFAAGELVAESARQFGADGAGFEASTCYHRLSAEMVVYGLAFLLGPSGRRLSAPMVPEDMGWRLRRMAGFSRDITKPNGRVVQIGDNDNGRFLKLTPCVRPTGDGGWREEMLDHRSLVAAIDGLLDRSDLATFAGADMALETAVVRGLASGIRLPTTDGPLKAVTGVIKADDSFSLPLSRPGTTGREIVVVFPDAAVLEEVEPFAYVDFGLFGWRSPRLFVSVRCGPIGQNGAGGHAHNDQLALELQVDGRDWLADPGCYVYTADPERREAYRSVMAHAAPRLGTQEPVRRSLGLFRLDDAARARCLGFDATTFVGMHEGFGFPVVRTVTLGPGSLTITDRWVKGAIERHRVTDAQGLQCLFPVTVPFSPGYGLVETPATASASGCGMEESKR